MPAVEGLNRTKQAKHVVRIFGSYGIHYQHSLDNGDKNAKKKRNQQQSFWHTRITINVLPKGLYPLRSHYWN